jgi:hypothetical protein
VIKDLRSVNLMTVKIEQSNALTDHKSLISVITYNSLTIQMVQARWPELPNAPSKGL